MSGRNRKRRSKTGFSSVRKTWNSALRGMDQLEARRLLDGHGVLNSPDVQLAAADVNGDGEIGLADYAEALKRLGDNVARGFGDIDGDGVVTRGDLEKVRDNFGRIITEGLTREENAALAEPIGEPQERSEEARFEQRASEVAQSLGRGKSEVAQAFLAGNARAVFYPILQAGSASATPPDSPTDRIDPNNVAGSEFGGVGSIEIVHPTVGTFICTGTVISPTQVLTAGHCFDIDNDGVADPGTTGTFNLNDGSSFSSTHTVAQIHTHPDFAGFNNGGNDDLSILELATPVPSATPTYSIRPGEMTVGEVLEMVGYGQAGDGDTGYTILPSFTDKRVGANQADLFVLDDEGTGVDEVYFFDFDEPTGTQAGNFGSTTLGNDVETTVGGGDSGSPAFVEVDGERVLAGVNTFNWELLTVTPPVGFFGSLGGGVMLGPYIDWIASIAPNAIDANDAPTFTPGSDVSVLEDASSQTIAWASDITANNSGQTTEFHIVSNSDPSLFEVAPEIAADGTLTFTAKANVNGSAEVTVVLQDDGGTAYGGQNASVAHTLTIDILAVNDAPIFSLSADIVALQNAGPQTVTGFAHDFNGGPLESSQTAVEYLVTSDNPGLFLQAPAISNSGELTFTPRADLDGLANLTVQVRDSGSTANGGVDLSEQLPFSITIEPVDPPPPPVEPPNLAFTLEGDVEISEDTRGQIQGFVSAIGEDVESFQLVNDNESMFQVQPRINAAGVLRFAPKPDAFGTASVKVISIGENTESVSQVFQLTVNPINDAPSITIAGDIDVTSNSGANAFPSFATDFDPGNIYEAQGIAEFVMKNDNEGLFTELPRIDSSGQLTFELSGKAGVANVGVFVRDDGGTANGGQDLSEGYEFTINVVPDTQILPTAVVRDGRLVIQGVGQQLMGLEFRSKHGLLSNGPSTAPFEFYLAETPEWVSIGVLGRENVVDLNGEIETSIFYSGTNADDDLTASWGDIYGKSFELEVTVEAVEVSGVVRDGYLVVQGSGQRMLGLEFSSDAGLLSNDTDPEPFRFFLIETPEQVSFGSLGRGNAVTLDGDLTTPVRYSGANPEDDLTAVWGDLFGQTAEFEVTMEVPDVVGVVRNGRIVLEGNGQQMIGLEFRSESGLLSSDPSPAPFEIYLSETPETVSQGVLGRENAVSLDGSVVTSVSYAGLDAASDLQAVWGDVDGDLHQIQIVVESIGLTGFLDSSNYLVLQGAGQKVVGLDLIATDGGLIPLEDGEEEPFTFTISNTEQQITIGNLGTSVPVDGLVRTNVQYVGDLDQLSITWGDETGTSYPLSVSRSDDPCAVPSLQTLSDCADGSIEERDAILAELRLLPGDIDGNGAIDFLDFLTFSENFAKFDRTYVQGDLNLDGKITFGDFLILTENFGKTL